MAFSLNRQKIEVHPRQETGDGIQPEQTEDRSPPKTRDRKWHLA
jgi:hypothetical protein